MYTLYIDAPLEFSAEDQPMFHAFDALTELFLKHFKNSEAPTLKIAIRWCKQYYDSCAVNASFEAPTFDELFELIREFPLHNFLDPGLLKYLAELSTSKHLIQSVKNFETTFSPVKLGTVIQDMGARIKSLEIVHENEVIINCSDMVTKLERENLTVGELRGFTVNFQERILSLHVGIIHPLYVKKGCISIEWLIPSCLVDYAYQSACLNTKLFSEMNLVHVTIGKYKVKYIGDSDGSMYAKCTFLHCI